MHWKFLASSAVICPDFAATVTAFFLSYMQVKTEGEFLQRLRPLTAGSNSPLSGLPRILVIFGTASFIYDPWSRP